MKGLSLCIWTGGRSGDFGMGHRDGNIMLCVWEVLEWIYNYDGAGGGGRWLVGRGGRRAKL